ncbi:MAG: transposase [Pseudobutyrivibrio sp.]|nr:transposase [Pseudobutyrivibrio sp.]
MSKPTVTPLDMAHFKFGLIAPVIQDRYPDSSAMAYYRRVTAEPIERPDGTFYKYNPGTLQKWVSYYRSMGMDGLITKSRVDKGTSRKLNDVAIEEIYRLREKYPKINATMIRTILIKDGFITSNVNVRALQRFIKSNDLKSARNINVKDRKAFEEEFFGCMWQADTCYLPYITEDGKERRTYLIMIIDDHSRMIVGGEIFYNDNALNFQRVLKRAVKTYGIPDKLYLDNGSPYSNEQLNLICDSIGTLCLHTPVRDGASKGKVERNFRTLKDRWLYALDHQQLQSLEEFNKLLRDYIYQHNSTVHSATQETPMDRFLKTKEHIRKPKSADWLEENFHNRITRKVNNDATISLFGHYYDVPPQFIKMRVDVRFLPDSMDKAYIIYEGNHYPIFATDKVANSKTKRSNDFPTITY